MNPGSPSSDAPLHHKLHVQILAAMAAGAALGFAFGESAVPWVGWMGTLFVRLLRMIIVPLIFVSVVGGVASVGGGRSLGRLGLKTFAYYVSTSFLAIVVGLAFVNMLAPGAGANIGGAMQAQMPDIEKPGSLLDIFLRLVPLNPVRAMASGDMLGIIFFAILSGAALTQIQEYHRERLTDSINAAFDL
ncbi:MAG: dicarboxylate/amino acid:cation symporter, partial [Myxococcota bacterium]